MRVIGLMSGTSLDGIDAALVEFEGDRTDDLRWALRAFVDEPYAPEQRSQIHEAIVHGDTAVLSRLHADLGEWFAAAALCVCEQAGLAPADVALIGSHGQTVWHEPPDRTRPPDRAARVNTNAAEVEREPNDPAARGATLQLGCAATIAERTGIAVVSDFRARDMAAGGEGAPLVPWSDRLLFALPDRRRALQNIGGMANVTWLPPRRSTDPILAFDTGPGVALIDAAVELASGGTERYDRDGGRAARGNVGEALLAELLTDPFFDRSPPKSTGREAFGRPFVEALVRRIDPRSPDDWSDLVATLTAFTARSIAEAYRRWVIPRGVDEIVVTGGGARNPVLCAMLEHLLAPLPVFSGEDALGIDPDAKEAVAFAALAWAFAHGVPGNIPEATGAVGPRVLGSYTPGSEG